jgi:uncharacterized protein (DUF58 family)
MYPTRRLWAILGLPVGLAVLAILLGRLLPLVGAVLVGAWVMTRQYLFLRATQRFVNDVSVIQSPAREWIRTDETIPVTLTATLDRSSRLACLVNGGLPTGATASTEFSTELTPGATSAERTVDARWPVAGRHTFEQPTLTVTDGLFEQSVTLAKAPSVTVEPRGPRNVHVGEGGEQFTAAYGEHDAGRQGSGIEPAELREYMPGDTLNQIDWNATARLGTPHVREFDAETDRKTVLVVDHRSTLAMGPPDETKLAYLREIALVFADSAKQLGDPLGLLTVGDAGITAQLTPATTAGRYTMVRQTLLELAPTTAQESATDQLSTEAEATQRSAAQLSVPESPIARRGAAQTVADVQRSLAALDGDGTFEETIRPFYANRQRYHQRIETDPLYGAVQQTLATSRGPVFTVLCTDDSAPVELRETVQLARREGGRVLVLLAPTVLYEPGGLSDLEQAYERYVSFEELRRELAHLDGVTALEVGPGDRLSTVLDAGRETRQSVGGGRL